MVCLDVHCPCPVIFNVTRPNAFRFHIRISISGPHFIAWRFGFQRRRSNRFGQRFIRQGVLFQSNVRSMTGCLNEVVDRCQCKRFWSVLAHLPAMSSPGPLKAHRHETGWLCGNGDFSCCGQHNSCSVGCGRGTMFGRCGRTDLVGDLRVW